MRYIFMDAIANWIAKNPYLTAAGLFATFLGLIIAIVTPIIQRKRKRLYYTLSTTPLVKGTVSNIKDLEVLFSGKHIERLSVTNVKLWNSGNTLITNDDFYKKHELKLINHNTKNCTILGVDIIKQSADTIQCEIDDTFTFSFEALEKKDYITFNIYHTGNENVKFALEGKIKEGKIINKTIDVEKQLSIITDMTIGTTTNAMVIESAFSVLLSSISQLIKPKKDEE